ncbi:50S ribosomal protein L16 [Candidatus Pacearchaeota archaeon]|nr:50S ribosomal protein L16 [Candidatus Pacearchaeota archaeon]
MGLRKALAYSKKKVRPYTRKSGRRDKAYIKSIPQSKITKFNMGDQQGFNHGKHEYSVKLVAGEKVQIRDNALEAGRMQVNKKLDNEIPGNYYFSIMVYPHHILRENKSVAAVAGADRLSSGMKHSFGVTVGRAAIVNPGKEIFFVSCTNERAARVARQVLIDVKSKVPCKSKVVWEKVRHN